MCYRNILSIGLLLMTFNLSGCASVLLDREDRLRKHEVNNGNVGINITTATRRLAIIHPSGRTCSELSPPAVIQADSEHKGQIEVDGTPGSESSGSLELERKRQETAVQLLTTNERIECLRMALFHACGIGVQSEMSAKEEGDILSNAIQMCGRWGVERSTE